MNKAQTFILQWARRLRDFVVEHDLKSEIAELSALRQELDDAIGQLTTDAASQEAITKQARVQTTEIKRLRAELRDGHIKPIVRMSRTMQLEMNGSKITFVLPNFNVDNERLAQAADGMVKALNILGPQFVARGFAANFVEQLTNATKALRDAVDQRAGQVARRTGATAAMEGHENRIIQLVGVIDTLVRPVIRNDPELIAAWENLVALPRTPKAGGVVVTPAAGASHPPTPASSQPATLVTVPASSTPVPQAPQTAA
jgi:hypothetical protein